MQFNIFFCIFIFQGSEVFNLQFFCILYILLLQMFEADVIRGVDELLLVVVKSSEQTLLIAQ